MPSFTLLETADSALEASAAILEVPSFTLLETADSALEASDALLATKLYPLTANPPKVPSTVLRWGIGCVDGAEKNLCSADSLGVLSSVLCSFKKKSSAIILSSENDRLVAFAVGSCNSL